MSLRAIQRNFRDWLTQESAAAAAALGDAAAPGLAVHLNTYRGQLMACLTEAYGVVHAWLGDEAFAAAAATHIDRVPPCSWTLDDYAQDFPDTLCTLYAADPEVAELACLEQALAKAFIGPDCDAVDPATLADIDWDRAVLKLVPTFMLLPATTNAAAIWSALAGEPGAAAGDSAPPQAQLLPAPAQLAVWRVGFTPRFRTLEAAEAEALALMAGGRNFGDLCALLAAREGDAAGAALAGGWLGQWLQDGVIAAVHKDRRG